MFLLHGTPGSRRAFDPWVLDARARGLRLLTYDRPGYGGSTARPGRSVGDVAEDVAEIADALGLERFAVWGFSGGGAPALACAARLPKRVVGAASIAGVAPYPAEGLDWVGDAGELNAEDFRLMLADRPAWLAKSKKDREEMLTLTPAKLEAMFASLLSDVDRAASTPAWTEFLVAQIREGLAPGDEGIRDDNLSTILPWGFRLEEIPVPTQLWHGAHDRFVPFTHGQWLARRIPNVEAHLEPAEGHTSLTVRKPPEVHAWLNARF